MVSIKTKCVFCHFAFNCFQTKKMSMGNHQIPSCCFVELIHHKKFKRFASREDLDPCNLFSFERGSKLPTDVMVEVDVKLNQNGWDRNSRHWIHSDLNSVSLEFVMDNFLGDFVHFIARMDNIQGRRLSLWTSLGDAQMHLFVEMVTVAIS